MKKTFKGSKRVVLDDADKLKKGFQGGLFAAKDLAPGEIIFYAKGKVVYIDIASKEQSATYPNALGIGRGKWLDPEEGNPLRYLNHSCNPNAGIKGKVTIVARKPIKQGEHITIDYSITECDELWDLGEKCVCGAEQCRKVIKSIQHLPLRTYKKYLPYINTAMQKEYERVHNL